MQYLLALSQRSLAQRAGWPFTFQFAVPSVPPSLWRVIRRVIVAFFLILFFTVCMARAQETNLPFEVSNPKHKKLPEAQAMRIYTWACNILARSLRPEKPPELHPKFRLVLGTEQDEFVRDSTNAEIHLKNWNAEKFAQAVVVVALRDMVHGQDLAKIAHESVSMADATVDVHELSRH
jgi:hypothetical protein